MVSKSVKLTKTTNRLFHQTGTFVEQFALGHVCCILLKSMTIRMFGTYCSATFKSMHLVLTSLQNPKRHSGRHYLA